MISLDTNVVLRFLLGDVADQTKKSYQHHREQHRVRYRRYSD